MVKENAIDLSECLYSWKQSYVFSSIKKKKINNATCELCSGCLKANSRKMEKVYIRSIES